MLLFPNSVYGFIAKQKESETELLLRQRLSFNAYKT